MFPCLLKRPSPPPFAPEAGLHEVDLPSLTSPADSRPLAQSPPAAQAGRIVLSGYYGFANLGDEAILTALVQQLREAAPEASLVALSGDPAHTRRTLGIEAVHRLDAPGVFNALRGASLFVSGGGSLLQDVTGLGSVPYYLGLIKLAQLLGVRTMFLGQGVGPLNLPSSRWLVGQVARAADALTVRDEASRDLLSRCGVPKSRIQLTADPVLALAPAPKDEIDALWARLGLEPGRPTIGVAIRPWSTWFERQLKAFSAVLAQHALTHDAQVLLLPFHRPDDVLLHAELRECMAMRPEGHRPPVVTLEAPLAPAEMMGLLGRLDLLVGMRLHALIMAAASATPAIGLVYDPKVSAFSDLAGFPTIASITALEDSDNLARTMAQVWEHREAVRVDLKARQARWREQALENVAIAAELARRQDARTA